MAWYKNCSPSVQSVPIGDGNVVAVRPTEVVEVVLETPTLRRLLGSRKVVRTGRPLQPVPPRVAPVEPVKPLEPPVFAQRVQEKIAVLPVHQEEAPKVVEAPAVQVADTGKSKKRNRKW